MSENMSNKIQKLEQKIENLIQQKEQLEREEKEKRNKARNHRLIEEGSFLENLIGNLGKEEVKKRTARMFVLEKLYSKQQLVLRYLFGNVKLHMIEQLFQDEFLILQDKVTKIRESKARKKEEQIQELIQRQKVFFDDLFQGINLSESDSTKGKLVEIRKLEDKYKKLINHLIEKGGN